MGGVPEAFVAAIAVARDDAAMLGLLGEDAAGEPWEVEGWRLVATRQAELGLREQAVRNAERAGLDLATPSEAPAGPDVAVVFSGHLLDLPTRAEPRFPARQVAAVRAWLRRELERLAPEPASAVGVSGAARGGDLLFLDEAHRRGMPTHVLLALPVPAYRRASVDGAGPEWGELFERLVPRDAPVLQQDEHLPPPWVSRTGWGVWTRNNWWTLHHALGLRARRTVLLALWNGREGDGPGGTRDMVEAARRMGVTVEIADPLEL